MIDIHGCPVDSDLDGVPDYLDSCPHNDPGAYVDSTGCPIDSDEDGIPDGLDDCPGTLPGVDVDQNGCIDLEVLSRPMIFHIDYEPGSIDIDQATTERFARLARMLEIAPAIRLEVAGYTDNVGTANANREVSKKRADVIRDFLIRMGVEAARIASVGKGEVDFIASNDTAEGRKRNRRVVITFLK